MRLSPFVLASLFAVASLADEYDAHRAGVVDKLLREIKPADRTGVVFVRMRERCWSDESQREGCVDLSDEALDRLRLLGHNVERVPEASRYYIYGDPSTHVGDVNPPPPDWLYLPIYTPAAQLRTYCEVERISGMYPHGAIHINGRCFAAVTEVKVLASGDFLVRKDGEAISIEPFDPPPGCILPLPQPPER
jgi:hypothetical protein